MPYSVEYLTKQFDVTVSKPAHERRVVYLDRYKEGRFLLCEVFDSAFGGYTVVVSGDEEKLVGPRLMEGFRTIMDAFRYALTIRTDINRTYKDHMGYK